MKKAIFFFVAALVSFNVFAQQQPPKETQVKYNKTMVNGVVAEYAIGEEVISKSLFDYLSSIGISKPSSSNGYKVFKAAMWGEISPEKLDIYIKTDGSRSKSTVTIILSKGYDNYVTSQKDADIVQRLNSFLGRLQLYANVVAQQEFIKKVEEDMATINKETESLKREQDKLSKKIEENKSQSERQQKALESEQAKLEELKKQLPQH